SRIGGISPSQPSVGATVEMEAWEDAGGLLPCPINHNRLQPGHMRVRLTRAKAHFVTRAVWKHRGAEMSESNQTNAGGSVPVGRIAGVAILAGGVIAMAVVAMNNQNRPIEPAIPNQQVAHEDRSTDQAAEEPGL